MNYISYHDILKERFEKRQLLNSSYSLRAFARDLGISVPRLSQILNGKLGLSIKAAKLIAERLKLSEEEFTWFNASVGSQHSRKFKERENYKNKIEKYKSETKAYSQIHMEYFKVIADWYHFAILELTALKEFKNDTKWIAKTLGITAEEAQAAIERMKSLDLLREENGKLIDAFKFLATTNDVPSMSLKKFHAQLIKKSLDALYEQEVSNREVSSTIFAVNKNQLAEFKEKIRSFRQTTAHAAEQTQNKDSVYCLSIQLFELSRSDS